MPRVQVPDPHDHEAEGLRPAAAASFMGLSVPTLERWRKRGIGPRFVQEGKGFGVIYPRTELVDWLNKSARSKTASRRR